ncbi:MAG: folate-binding protein YgfZ [Acidobacteriales bacterium]|nr:folate-binding protein YgfZ [Candidatus Koribacter versatilis]MBI3647138.1 folate-binding protein YgfZ [Terriglobales bacterium]
MTVTTIPGTDPGTPASTNAAPDFGDLRAEFRALLSTCGVYDLGWRSKIALTGSDRVRWLNGMITNNVRDLAVGHGVYAFLLDAQGHIQADLYAFNRGESLLVDTERSQRDKVLQLFDHYIIADDVELADISEKLTALGLTGPESRSVLERAGVPVPDLAYLQFGDVQWQEIAITVLHSGEEAKDSWQVWIAPEHVSALWDALVKAGARSTGTSALNLFRISRGIPQFGQDIRERDLPQETGQMRALNFTKGCYLGQEIVERIRSRGAVHRQFTAFLVEGPLPEPGAKIQADSKEVGEITSSAILPLPAGDRGVALGYLRREATGKELTAGNSRLTLAPSLLAFVP